MTKISEMTPEGLRIKCAEKIGWKIILTGDEADIYTAYNPSGEEVDCDFYMNIIDCLPDYEHDRNALQTLIEAVSEDKREDFLNYLIGDLGLGLELFDSALEGSPLEGNVPHDLFTLLTADPLSIMRAFLEVME